MGYWAVDWGFKGDTFHNQWQAYRTRKDPKLELATSYEYKEPGKYQFVVKVIDILGNDITKTLQVTVQRSAAAFSAASVLFARKGLPYRRGCCPDSCRKG